MEQSSQNSSQVDAVRNDGLLTAPSTRTYITAGESSSVADGVRAWQALASTSSDGGQEASSDTHWKPSPDAGRDGPFSPSPSTSSSSSSSHDRTEGIAGPGRRKRGEDNEIPKKERLRKGKWTIEEEEYTSRIIQFFSTGLLTVPDGATLRSYLAEKLGCDPMRITKKFTGACCLGRRAYHLRDRPRASPAEVEMARLEVEHLERRFRLRVEHEQTGLQLPPRHELLAALPPPCAAAAGINASSVVPSSSLHSALQVVAAGAPSVMTSSQWLQQQNPSSTLTAAATNYSSHGSVVNGIAGLNAFGGINLPGAFQNNASLPLVAAAGQMLLQNAVAERIQPTNTAQLQLLNSIVTSLALAQAAARLNQAAAMSPLPTPTAPMFASIPSMPSISGVTDSAVTGPTEVSSSSAGGICASKDLPSQGADGTAHLGTLQNLTQQLHQDQQRVVVPNQQHLQTEQQMNLQRAEQEKQTEAAIVAPSLAMQEHVRQLKAAFQEQQRALRLAYEKTLREAEEQEQRSSSGGAASGIDDASMDPLTVNSSVTAGSSDDGNGNLPLRGKAATPAEQLQRNYEAHLASLLQSEEVSSVQEMKSSSLQTRALSTQEAQKAFLAGEPMPGARFLSKDQNGATKEMIWTTKSNDKGSAKRQTNRKPQDEEAGTILLGFLNSLRDSFVDAVEEKNCEDRDPRQERTDNAIFDRQMATFTSTSESKRSAERQPVESPGGNSVDIYQTKNVTSASRRVAKRPRDSSRARKDSKRREESAPMQAMSRFPTSQQRQLKPACVTEASSGTSSQPATEQSSSSLEDSDSKSDKTDQFSSEESLEEKDNVEVKNRSKGPPRKRLKGYDNKLNEFTRENLLEHSKRMDMERTDYSGGSSTN